MLMRGTFARDSTKRMKSTAARRFTGSRAKVTHTQPPVPVDSSPVSACGMGAPSHFANSAAESRLRRSGTCQLPPRNMAASPAVAASVSCW
jgi:hypothetical protein